jgi:hypothetical protein
MTQYAFGAGSLWNIPGTTNPTPSRLGALQQAGVDFNANTVNLFGSYQFPLASARGTVKIDGTGKFAQLNGHLLNDVFFSNSSLATGTQVVVDLEAGAIPGSVAYTVTVAGSATWTTDLGVIDAINGTPYVRVSAVAAAGQYSVSAGVYTFYVDDKSKNVLISYIKTAVTGETLTMGNALMGVAAAFKAVLMQSYNAQQHVLTLNKAIAAKFSLQTALEDFAKPDFTFGAFSDSSNTIGTWSFAEAS